MKWLRFLIVGLGVLCTVAFIAAGLPYGSLDWMASAQPYTPPPNLALNQRAVASTSLQDHPPSRAVDGMDDTTWRSYPYSSYQQWIYVFFGEYRPVDQVVIDWAETGYARNYQVYALQRSGPYQFWQALHLENSGNGGEDVINFAPVSTAAILVTMWGRPFQSNSFAIDELEAYLYAAGPQGPDNLAAFQPAWASSYRSGHPPENATDTDYTTSWQPRATSFGAPAIAVDLGNQYPVRSVDIHLGDSASNYRVYIWTFVWYGWTGRWAWYPVASGNAAANAITTATFGPMDTRYVAVGFGNRDVMVNEIEVYGQQQPQAGTDALVTPQDVWPADQEVPDLVPPGWEDTPEWRQAPFQDKLQVPELVPADKLSPIDRQE